MDDPFQLIAATIAFFLAVFFFVAQMQLFFINNRLRDILKVLRAGGDLRPTARN